MFSTLGREPSFHLGLFGPLLRSALWRGMAFSGGLHPGGLGPGAWWMLTSDLFSPPAFGLIVLALVRSAQSSREAISSCCFALSLCGSYSFPSFHIFRTRAATLRAMVSLARFGFVPPSVSLT